MAFQNVAQTLWRPQAVMGMNTDVLPHTYFPTRTSPHVDLLDGEI